MHNQKIKINLLIVLCFLLFPSSLSAAYKSSFSKIIKQVSLAVVSVYASSSSDNVHNSQLDSGAIYKHIFGNNINSDFSIGSGVIISDNGLIITNAHVVDQRNIIKIVLNNGKEYYAKVLEANLSLDLSLLQIDDTTDKFSYLSINDRDDNEVGDVVLAIGNPFGIWQTVTSGIISGFRYFEKNQELGFGKLIQIDAAINPGNSGGALVNSIGELIGINSNIYSYNNNMASGIGFAIPTSVVDLFVKRHFHGGILKKYWIGLTGVSVNNDIANKISLNKPYGVYVNNVIKDGPADIATIRKGDILIKFGKNDINTISDLAFNVAKIDSEKKINVTVVRNNKNISLTLIPEVPKENPKKMLYSINQGVLKKTIFANNSPLVSYEINSDISQQGVVIYALDSNSFLKKLGIQIGDFITKIGNKDINSTEDLRSYIEKHLNYNSYEIVLKRRNQIINLNINNSVK